jgi:chromosome partitioning protein
MEIWTFATQKGGAGKTTLVTNLSVTASESGEKVLIIDLDPQESATKWWERRDSDAPHLVKINSDDLEKALRMAEEQKFTLVLLDTAGHQTLNHNQAILSASFCVVPCQPSIADIEAVYQTVELLKRTNRSFAFVLTRCPAVGQDQESARKGLSALGLVAKPTTIERKAYKHAFATGEGVTEYDASDKASDEIKTLYKWIRTKSKRLAS